ncbi:MAG: GNAT family N-acetyltransferase [Prevotella sp.]|nr:GNAT family N-acetyltransferase [Prevotella sp.]
MTTPQIQLRALEPEDLDDLYAIENDRDVWCVGHTNVPYSRYALHDYIATQQADIYADRQLRLIVADAEGRTVGMVDLMNFDPQHQRAELGIVVKQAARRQGFGTRAVAAILDYARLTLHLHQVYVVVSTDNSEALSLFRRAGFADGGRLSDWLYDGNGYHDAVLMQTFL